MTLACGAGRQDPAQASSNAAASAPVTPAQPLPPDPPLPPVDPPHSSATPLTLTIGLYGDGTGRVVSTPAGIDCPGACTATFPAGVAPDLTASPTGTSKFGGWTMGPCHDAGTSCHMDGWGNLPLGARFDSDRVLVITPLDEVGVGAFTLNSSDLFYGIISWPGGGWMKAFPKAGGTRSGLSGSDTSREAIADDAMLFWSASVRAVQCLPGYESLVVGVPVAGGKTIVLADGVNIRQLALDDRFVYFSRAEEVTDCSNAPLDGKGAVLRVPRLGGSAELLAGGQTPTGALALDGDSILFGNRDAASGMEIRSVPRSGGAVTTLLHLEGTAAPVQLKVDAQHLYVRDISGQLLVADKTGSTPPSTLVSDGSRPVTDIDVHSGRVYWGQFGGVWSALPDGTERTLIVPQGASRIAVDDTYIFYVSDRLIRYRK
jgi:hypothetical protein